MQVRKDQQKTHVKSKLPVDIPAPTIFSRMYAPTAAALRATADRAVNSNKFVQPMDGVSQIGNACLDPTSVVNATGVDDIFPTGDRVHASENIGVVQQHIETAGEVMKIEGTKQAGIELAIVGSKVEATDARNVAIDRPIAGVAKHHAALLDLVDKPTTVIATAMQDVGLEIRAGPVLCPGKSGAIPAEAIGVVVANYSSNYCGNFDASIAIMKAYKLGNNKEKNLEEN